MQKCTLTRFSRFGANLGHLIVYEAVHDEELTGADSLELITPEDLNKGDRIVWQDGGGVWHEQIVDQVEREHTNDGQPLTQATCINSIAELWGDYLDDVRPGGTAGAMLARVLEGTRWTAGVCDVSGISATKVFYHTSVREAVTQIAENFGAEVETVIECDENGVTARTIRIRSARGNTQSKKRFTWGKDIISAKRTVETTNPVTRVYGYGAGVETEGGGYGRRITFADINDGKSYVEDTDATLLYGHLDANGNIAPEIGVFLDEECEEPAQLLAETKEYLERVKQPVISYEFNVVDLFELGRDWEYCGIGDKVCAVDADFANDDLRVNMRVSKIRRDLITGETTITIGAIPDALLGLFLTSSGNDAAIVAADRTENDGTPYAILTSSGALYFIAPDYVPQVGENAGAYVPYDFDTITNVYSGFDVDYSSTLDNMPWYAQRNSIVAAIAVDVIELAQCWQFFANLAYVQYIDVRKFRFDNCVSMQTMFSGCYRLTSIEGLTRYYLGTSHVTSMRRMFYNCASLEYIDVSAFQTQSVTDMYEMFRGCYSLAEIVGLANFSTAKVTTFSGMFQCLPNLTELDLSSFSNAAVTQAGVTSMFASGSAWNPDTQAFEAVTSGLVTIWHRNNSALWNVARFGQYVLAFGGNDSLVGTAPNGTQYSFDEDNRNANMARVATNATAGYFTDITLRN